MFVKQEEFRNGKKQQANDPQRKRKKHEEERKEHERGVKEGEEEGRNAVPPPAIGPPSVRWRSGVAIIIHHVSSSVLH